MMCMCVGLCINKVSLQSYNKYCMEKRVAYFSVLKENLEQGPLDVHLRSYQSTTFNL